MVDLVRNCHRNCRSYAPIAVEACSSVQVTDCEQQRERERKREEKKKRTCMYRGYMAVGRGVMQLHGGCRLAPGASAARAEPLHVLVLSSRAAVPGKRGTAKRAGAAPSTSCRLALAQREPAASNKVP